MAGCPVAHWVNLPLSLLIFFFYDYYMFY
jgi:hypothetical protein